MVNKTIKKNEVDKLNNKKKMMSEKNDKTKMKRTNKNKWRKEGSFLLIKKKKIKYNK